jgi:DNA-binding response OmpR family regulator
MSPRAARIGRLVLFVGNTVRPDQETNALLERGGARAVCIGGLAQAAQTKSQVVFDAAVVDAALLRPPEEAWVAKLRRLLECPLLVVADWPDEVDEIIALEQGADDYLVRPLSSRRLSARIGALLRTRSPQPAPERPAQRSLAGWRLDPAMRRLVNGERQVELTELLANLLARLLDDPGRVVSREQLLHRLRCLGSRVSLDGVDTYVHRLRRCLAANAVSGLNVVCLRGRGYLVAPCD